MYRKYFKKFVNVFNYLTPVNVILQVLAVVGFTLKTVFGESYFRKKQNDLLLFPNLTVLSACTAFHYLQFKSSKYNADGSETMTHNRRNSLNVKIICHVLKSCFDVHRIMTPS